MRPSLLGIVLIGLLVVPCQGQEGPPMLLETESSKQLFADGRRHLMNFQVAKAERIFEQLGTRPDGAIAALYHLTTTSFLKASVTDDPDHFDEFHTRSDSLRELLKDAPETRWSTYLLGEANLQRAVMAAKTEHNVRAALAGRSAYKRFEDALDGTDTFYEPYKGIGLAHLMIGSLPSTYRWLLRLLGMKGDVQQGLDELRIAAERSQYNREEAQVYLALIDILINNSTEGGVRKLQGLHASYPHSLLFDYLYGFALLSDRQAVAAERLLRQAVERGRDSTYFFIDYAEYYLAEALFKQNRFAEAEVHFRSYLMHHRGPALRALAHLQMGLALEMQDKREEAVYFYEQINTTRSFDSDQAALRAAEELLDAPMNPYERKLLRGRNAYEAGQYARAKPILAEVHSDPQASAEERAEAAFYLGRAMHAQGQLDEARQAYQYAVDHPGDEKARWAPWGQFHIGEIHEERGDTLQASGAYEAALTYDGRFDYRQSLEQRAKAALGRLQGES